MIIYEYNKYNRYNKYRGNTARNLLHYSYFEIYYKLIGIVYKKNKKQKHSSTN